MWQAPRAGSWQVPLTPRWHSAESCAQDWDSGRSGTSLPCFQDAALGALFPLWGAVLSTSQGVRQPLFRFAYREVFTGKRCWLESRHSGLVRKFIFAASLLENI